jgi:hypothetical protein
VEVMYLRDLDVWADDSLVENYKGGFVQRFWHQASCITELIRHLLAKKKVFTAGIGKVCITLYDELHSSVPVSAESSLGTVEVDWPFDFARFTSVDETMKKRMLFDMLNESLHWLFEKEEWDRASLEEVCEEALNRNLTLEGFAKDSWLSKDSRFRARVYFRWEYEAVELYAVLFRNRKKQEICRKHLASAIPSVGCLHEYLANGRWISNTRFQLESRSFRQERWAADFSEVISAMS